MNDSSTPKTDAVKSDVIGFYSCATVPATFAELLEMELRAHRDELIHARAELALWLLFMPHDHPNYKPLSEFLSKSVLAPKSKP